MSATLPVGGDVEPHVPWTNLVPGQEVEIRESGRPAGRGVVDNLTPDASVAWVRLDGHTPRRMYLAGDPVQSLPERQNPDAY
jgi:hypothetical protein